MIHFLVGKPRNGKTLRAMMHIIEQLTTTSRWVVTNMVIRFDLLQELLDARGHDVHVIDRVTQLTDEEVRDFWLYRGGGYKLPVPPDYEEKKGAHVDYRPLFEDPRFRVGNCLLGPDGQPAHFRGVAYLIDECHTIWPARGWQGTPRHADFYCSQHGKLNDEVWFITQNVKLVDPNFARLAQDFTYCRNHRIEKHGRFRGDNKFTAKTYPGPVASGNEVTLNVETYRLDKAVADCYDTSAGVGMPGGGTADAGHRAKGLSLRWVWVGLAAAIALIWSGLNWGIPHLTRRFVAPAVDPQAHAEKLGRTTGLLSGAPPSKGEPRASEVGTVATAKPPPALPAESLSRGLSAADGPPRGEDGRSIQPDQPPQLWVDGYIVRGRHVNVSLSDGRTLTERDGLLERVERNFVEVAGVGKVWIRRPEKRPENPQAGAPAPALAADAAEPASAAQDS